MIEFALFGAGRIGEVHARLVASHPGASLRYVVDPSSPRANALALRHDAMAVTAEAALEDPETGAVLIATSTDTHADLIERAAAAGKPVFCEKPIDLDIARADQAVAAAERAGIPLMIGLNRRFDPTIVDLKAKLDAGAIGRPVQLVMHNGDRSAPPVEFLKHSGGIFRDMLIHDIDVACWLLGEQPVKVFAAGAALIAPEIGAIGDYDTASATLVMPSGAQAVLTVTRFARFGFDQRLEMRGSQGWLAMANPAGGLLTEGGAQGFVQPGTRPDFHARYAEAFGLQLDAFIGALTHGQAPVPGAAEARRAMVIAEAATRAAAFGTAVEISGDGTSITS